MAKNIIFCADGTWNNPGDSADKDNVSTNVYALFNLLQGKVISRTKFSGNTGDVLELEKVWWKMALCSKLPNTSMGLAAPEIKS